MASTELQPEKKNEKNLRAASYRCKVFCQFFFFLFQYFMLNALLYS